MAAVAMATHEILFENISQQFSFFQYKYYYIKKVVKRFVINTFLLRVQNGALMLEQAFWRPQRPFAMAPKLIWSIYRDARSLSIGRNFCNVNFLCEENCLWSLNFIQLDFLLGIFSYCFFFPSLGQAGCWHSC